MALQRYTRPVDGTIPVPALLYDDEELLASQDNTGIYDGPQKSTNHQAGTIHVSTHRLFYIDNRHQFSHSFTMDLLYITRTEYYAGLFKSSSKVTIYLSAGTGTNKISKISSSSSSMEETENVFESWECEVCGNRNPPGLSPAAARICALCGVPRSSVPIPIKTPAAAAAAIYSPSNQGHLSSSLPASVLPSALSSFSSLSAHPSPPPPTTTSSRPTLETRAPSTIACPACTFLNHSSMRSCEMCTTPLPRLASMQTQPRTETAPASTMTSTKSAPSSRPVSPDLGDDDDDENSRGGGAERHMIKLSFRKGGDKAFYAVLKRSLMGKAWEGKTIGKGLSTASNASATSAPNTGRSGIHGILRTVETSAQNTATDMSDALKDLEALMVKAKDMVRLAAELNERLTASSTTSTTASTVTLVPPPSSSSSPSPSPTPTLIPSTEPEEATFIRSSLSQLGLQMSNAPVTLDMIRDERKWIEELARELAGVLQGRRGDEGGSRDTGTGMMRERGIVALDQVWGGWNRARGVALIPPSTFLLVLPHLPYHTSPPVRSRTFTSGLSVLHTPSYTHASFAARLASLLAMTGSKSTMEIAGEEKMAVGLAEEMINAVEVDGDICRDEGGAGGAGGGAVEVKWWVNMFRDYVWDGQE